MSKFQHQRLRTELVFLYFFFNDGFCGLLWFKHMAFSSMEKLSLFFISGAELAVSSIVRRLDFFLLLLNGTKNEVKADIFVLLKQNHQKKSPQIQIMEFRCFFLLSFHYRDCAFDLKKKKIFVCEKYKLKGEK